MLTQTPEVETQSTPLADSLEKDFSIRAGQDLLQSETVGDESEENKAVGPHKLSTFFH